MDVIQSSANNALGASLYIPESPLIGNTALLGTPINSQKANTASGLGVLTNSLTSNAPFTTTLSPTQSVVYLNNALPSNSTNLFLNSNNDLPLVSQDNFAVGSMPTSLTFLGSNLADDLYLKLDANGIINFSTDGSKFNALSTSKLASTNIAIALGEGDDNLYIDKSIFTALQSSNSKISFDGGSGKNTIFGAAVDTTWNITGRNSGKVGNLSFRNTTDLKAAAKNYATFVFSESGSLSGIADGGDGNLGTLIIDGGNYKTSHYVANDAHSGSIFLDDKLIRYDGLAPIIDNTNTAERTFTASAGNDQIVVDKRNTTIDGITADYVFINSLNNTFENVTYKFSPTSKLTINAGAGDDTIAVNWFVSTGASLVIEGNAGNDSVVIAKNLSLNGGGLTVNAETISVASGVTIDTTKVGGSSGAISLTANDTKSQAPTLIPLTTPLNATSKAQVNLTGATLKAGNITLSATSNMTATMSVPLSGTVSGTTISLDPVLAKATLGSTATVSLFDTRIESTGNVVISGISSVDGNATAGGISSYINTAVDAAVANSTITSSAIANISGQSSIRATGTLTLSAKNTVKATTTGNAAAASAGAGIAIANVTTTTKAYIDSASNQAISASAITLAADTNATVNTTAKASPGGSTQNSQTPEAATEGNAVTSGGAIGVAGALAFAKFKNTTEAYLASTNTATLTASTLNIGTTSINNVITIADGSTVSSGALGVGVAVAVNLSDVSNKAYIGGKAILNVGTTTVQALTPTTNPALPAPVFPVIPNPFVVVSANNFLATATSGAGAGSKVGVAGSFALNKLNNTSQALLLAGSVIDAGNGALTLSTTNKTNSVNRAISAQSGATTLGIGASFSLDLEENKTEALVQDNVTLTKAGTLTLKAVGDNANLNNANAGAGGSISVSPTVALTIVNNSTAATIGNAGTSGLFTVGAVDASATQTGVSRTNADGTVTASKVALGAALALSFVNDTVTSTTLRNITSTKGGVSFSALSYAASSASGTASAAGSDESKDSNDTSEKQVGDQLAKSDTSSKKADNQAAIKGQVKTSQGNVSVAAGIALNVVNSTANASLADGLTINSAGLFTLAASNETDATANSNGSAVGSAGASTPKIGVGVAVALNIVKSNNQATIGVANVTATGISLGAKMSAKDIGGDGVSKFDAIAVAGAGATKVGFAGALALTLIGDNPSVAAIKSGATVNAKGGDVTITSENTTTSRTYASGVQTAGSSQPKVGVGIAFALDKTDNRSEASVQDNVNLTNAGKLTLSAQSNNSSDTIVETGSAGDIAFSPSVAMNLVSNTTIATIGTGGLLTLGSVEAKADHTGNTDVKTDSSVSGGKAAIGAALSLNFVNDTTTSTTARNITATTGGVSFSALAYANTDSISKAAAGGTSQAKDSSDTADKQVSDQLDANDTSANAKQRKADAAGKAKSQDSSGSGGGAVSVAAGISLNLVTSTANASLGDGLVITSAGKFALTSSNETDARAIADGSTANGSNKVGIGAAVALNIVNAKNLANIGTGARITSEGLAIEAKMSPNTATVPANPNNSTIGTISLVADGTSTLVASSTSGGGGGKVGISGSFALNFVTTTTEAVIKAGAVINAGKGDISLSASSNEVDDVASKSKAEGGTVGVGASIGLNLLLTNPVRAEVEDTVTLNGGGSLKIGANSTRLVRTNTSAGSASDSVAVSPAVAIAIVNNDTIAKLGAGAGNLNLTGSVNITASHSGSVITKGDADAAGEKVAVGAIVAVNVSKDNTIAATMRDFTTTGGNVVVSSISAVNSSARVMASAAGNKQEEDGARNSDDEAAAQSGQKTLPKAKDNADKGNNSAKSSGASGSGVGVAAAVGVNWQIVNNQAIIADNLNITSNGGSITVSALNQTDAATRAIGTSLSKNATANVSAAVGLNVADVTNLAYVGKNVKINAMATNGTVGNITIAAITPEEESNEFVSWGFAASGGSSEKSKASVAGSAAINVLTFNNQAIIGDGAKVSTLGSVTLEANNPMIVQTLAISGAFSRGTSGGAAGAAISVNILTQNTTATISANAVVDASESISITSTSSVTPRVISVDDIKDIVNVITGTAEAIVPTPPSSPVGSAVPPSLDNIPGLDSLMPQLDTVIQPIINKLTATLIAQIENSLLPEDLKPYYVRIKADLDELIKNKNNGTLDAKLFVTKVIGLVERIAPNIPGVNQIFPPIQAATDIIVDNLRKVILNRIKDPNTTIANVQIFESKLSELNTIVTNRKKTVGGLDLGQYITQLNDLGKSVDPNFFKGLLFSELRKNQLKPIEDGIRSVITGAKNIAPFLGSYFDKLTTQLDNLLAKADPDSIKFDPNLDFTQLLFELTKLAKSIAVDFFASITAEITKLVPFTNVAIGAGVGQGQVGIGGSVVVDIFNVNTIASIASGAQINQDINTKAGRNQSISLSASDTTKINNIAGGLGATTGSAGIGIGVDVEILNRNVFAFIDSASNTATKVKAAGKISVQTSTSEDIFNLTLSAGVAAKLGVGGTVSYNEITNNVKSGIAGTISAGGDIIVTALDNSKILSLAGGFAIAAKLSEGGPKASIGAAVAINKINSTTEALISRANLSALGALAVNANTNATIQSVTIAGSGSASLGDSAAAFALGASIAINTVNSSVRAAIANGSNVQVGGLKTLSINAKDNSTINAFALGGALAVAAGGGTSVALAIGVSAARNEINGGAEAYVDGSTVTSSDSTKDADIDVQALSTNTISAQSIAVAIAIAKGSTAPSLSGGGAGAGNYIQTKTNAYVNNSTLTKIGKANLNANNTSNIDATVVAISGSISVGSSTGVGASIGAAVANNFIGYKENSDRNPSQVQAYVKNSSVKASGDLTVKAVADGSIVARVGAGSVAVAASTGSTGLSGSGSGVVTLNKIATLVKAFVDGDGATGIEAKSATLTATDSSKIKADAGAASIAVAAASTTGGSLSIGVAVASNLITNEVEAFVNNADNAFKTNIGAISLSATSSPTIEAVSVAASIAVGAAGTTGVGISGAGAAAINTILTKTNAYIKNSEVTSAAAVTLSASNTATINAKIAAVSAAVGGGGTTGVGVSIGAAVANNYIGYDGETTRLPAEVQAYIQNSAVNAKGALGLSAINGGSITAGVGAGSAAVSGGGTTGVAASGSGVVTLNKIATLVKAFVDGDRAKGIQSTTATLTAKDTSTITADAGAASLAIGGGGTTGVSLSIGVSVASNFITNEVEASIKNAAKGLTTSTGAVSLSSETNATIKAISVAASIAAGGGGTAGITISGAGAAAINTILTKTNAFISSSNVTSAGAVTLSSTNGGTIDAKIAAVSVSAGGGGTAGVGVSIGSAVANNYIGYDGSTRQPAEVQAYIQNSSVNAKGALSLTALNTATITAGVGAGSAAVSGGGTAGVAASGSGVGTENRIATLVKAFIDGDGATGIQSTAATLIAKDSSTITADAGAASVAASFGGTAGVSVSIGVSIAQNLISNEVEASIKNAAKGLTTGAISLTSETSATIKAVSVAASIAAGFGGTAGVSVSGAGAAAVNTILTKTNAFIANSIISSTGAVSLSAKNTASIDAKIVAASASVGGGGTAGVGVSVGAAVANNYIGYDGDTRKPSEVQAYIQNSSLTAGGALSLSAIDSATINAFVFSGSAAISGGGTAGVAASGSGVSTENKVATVVKAFVDGDGATGIQATQATLTAKDSSTIKADAGAASLSIAGSGTASVAGSIGVSLARNLVTSEVLAYVKNADSTLRTTTGNVDISATNDKASITAVSAAASLAAGVSGTAGVGVSGAGAESTNLIGTKTNAFIEDSVINSKGAVSLNAKNNAEIKATVIAASVALGASATAGVGVSIGVAVARNLIGWNVDPNQAFKYDTSSGSKAMLKGDRVKIKQGARAGDIYEFIGDPATIDLRTTDYGSTSNWKQVNLTQTVSEVLAYIDPTSIIAGGALTLNAVSSSTINASVTAASVAIAGGIGGASLSGAGVGVDNKIATNVKAFIDGDGSLGINATSISLTATDASTISTEAQAASIAATFAIGAAISVGVSIAKNEISNNVSAYVQNITAKGLVATTGDITLKAEEKATIIATSNAASVAAGLAGISGAGAVATNIISNSTKAYISNAIAVNAKGAVSLSSSDTSTINAFAGQVSGGTTAALGVSLAINTISNQITSDLDKANLTTQTGALTLNAISNSQIKSAAAGASLAGTASAAGALTLNTIRNVIRAGISNNSVVQTKGATNLSATDTSTIDSLAGQVSLSLQGSVGASVATNDINNQIIATIDKSKVTATGGANLNAKSQATVNAIAVGATGAGSFAAGGAVTLNKIGNVIRAAIANTSNVQTQGAINLTASDNSTINAFSGQLSLSGGASVGASVATNDIANQVIAEINQSTAIASAGAINLSATSTGTIKAAAAGGAGAGLFAAGGAVTLNKIANRTGAGIAGASTVQAQGNIIATSTNNATINSFAGQISGAGGAAIGAAVAINSIGNVTVAYFAGNVTSNAGKVSANAINTSTIEGKSAGASIAGGVALTGSVSVNNIANQTSALASTAKIKSFGNTEIIATDTSTINSMAGQISIGIGTAAVGAAVAYNNISNKVEAYVTADPSNPSTINATGNVLVVATGTNTINTIAAGGSASLGVAIAGSVAVNQMSNSVVAYAQNSTITAQGSVGVLANGINNMTTTGGAFSGGLVGVGATIVVNNLANSTRAFADKANISAFGGQTINVLNTDGSGTSAAFKGAAIMATSQDTLSTTIGTAGIGAAGLAVTIAVNTFGSTTEAIIRNSAVTGNNESAYLKAFSNSKINVTAGNISAGLLGLGGAIDVTNMNNTTNAYIDSRDPNNLRDDVLTNPLNAPATLSGGKDVAIEATTLKDVTSNTTAAGAGVGSVQGAVSLINMASGLSADAQKASNTTQGTVSTQLNDMDGMGKDSKGNSYISTKKNVLSNLSTNAPIVGGTNAFVIGYASAGNQLTISALERAKLNVKADAKSIGAVSVGGAVGIANIQNNASAYTVNSSRLTGGNISILATGVVDAAKVQTFAGSAGVLGLGAAVSNLSSDNNSKAYLGVNTVINQANNIKVQATSSSGLVSDARNFSLGIAAVGVVLSDAKETGKTSAYLDNGVKIQDAYSDLTVNAVANQAVVSAAQAAAGGILAGNGTIPTATISPTVQTSIGNNNQINVRGNVVVKSDVSIDADAGAEGINGGAITVGISQATVTATPIVSTFVGTNSSIQANNVTIASNLGKAPAANVDPSFNAATAVNGTNDTITFAGASGLTTGDQVLYKNGGGTTIGGLENNRNYNVIVTPTANTIQLGSQFSASSVDVLKNTITFAKEHSFKDNDKVIYKSSGTAIGGLTTNTAYYVRIIDSKTIQLSATPYTLDSNQRVVDAIEGAKIADITVGAASRLTVAADKDGNVINDFQTGNIVTYNRRTAQITVNKEPLPDTGGKPSIFNSADSSKDLIANNKITSAGHGFQNGDQVVFTVTGGAAIGGLTSGQTYFVRDAGDNDFKVSATSGGAAIDITSATGGTTAEFKAVGLRETTVNTFTYNAAAATAAVNTISITGHGFTNGQTVVYTGSGLGLTNNGTYFVVNATANSLQLANTNGGAVLSLTANAGTQTLTRTADLLENTNYYIVGANATSFQLAKQSGGTALTIVKTGLTGTGVNHIFTKQSSVDFTSNGTGTTDNLYFDISAGAGNKQTFTTGASVVLPTVGDQVFSAYSQASSGSLIGVNATKSTIVVVANVNTGVGDGSSIITKGDVNVLAQSNIALTGSTTSNTFGAVAVGGSTIEAVVINNNITSIGKNAKVQAAGNVTIDGQSAHNVRISGSGSAGSLITFARANATAALNHNTITNIGDGAAITSLRALNVRSGSNTFSNVSTDASGAGLFADADADSKFYSAGNHQTNVGAAYLEGRRLTVESVVNNLDVTSYARAQGAGLIGNIDAQARVELNGTQAITNIGSGASLKADDLNLNAIYKNVSSNATSNASCDGLGGDTDSETWNYMPLLARVVTSSNSTLTAFNLNVKSDFENFNRTTNPIQKKAWELRIWTPFGDIVITLDFGSTTRDEQFSPTSVVDFNSKVVRLGRNVNPLLVVNADGSIGQKSANVTANVTSSDITVNNIVNSGSGAINFSVNQSGVTSNGSFTDRGVYSSVDPAFDTVEIQNYSNRNLIINDIRTINTSGGAVSPNYSAVNVGSKTFASTTAAGSNLTNPSLITINNWGVSNLILNGVIDNPHDRTVIFSNGAIISQNANQQIITRDLSLTAKGTDIGSTGQLIKAKLVRGYATTTAAVPTSVSGVTTNVGVNVAAQGSINLNLTTQRLDANPITVTVNQISANTCAVNLKIDSTTDRNNAAIASTYRFASASPGAVIKARTTITLNAGTSNTAIDASFSSLTGDVIDVVSGSSLNLSNPFGEVRVKRLTGSTIALAGGNVSLVSGATVNAIQDVAINQTGNFAIDANATITAGNNVTITNRGTSNSTTSINGWISAKALSIFGNSSNDTINIQRIAASTPTSVNTGAGNDTVNVGGRQPSGNGTLSGILGRLTIDGASATDTLNIDDTGNTSNATGIITNSAITGFGMTTGSISYSNFEILNFNLGTGNNNVTINSTHAGTTNINGNTGNDTFTVNSIVGSTNISGGGGTNQLSTSLTLAPARGTARALFFTGGTTKAIPSTTPSLSTLLGGVRTSTTGSTGTTLSPSLALLLAGVRT